MTLYVLTQIACAFVLIGFVITVAIFKRRSQNQHAFPRATYALMVCGMFCGLHFLAEATGSFRLEVASVIGTILSGLVLIVLMAMEMAEAAHFPTQRAMFIKSKEEARWRKKAQVELEKRSQLLELNSEVGVALGVASSPRELATMTAETIADRLNLGLVRIWAIAENRSSYELQGMAGTHASGKSHEATIDIEQFQAMADARSELPFSFTEVSEDSKIIEQSDILAQGLEHSVTFPLLIEQDQVGMLELLNDQDFSAEQLTVFAPMAAALAQSLRRHTNERLLAASLRRFETLTKVAPAAIFVSRPDGQLTYSNRLWSEMTGHATAGTGGRPTTPATVDLRWFNALKHANEVRDQWKRAMRANRALRFEAQCRVPSDEEPAKPPRRRSVIGVVQPLPESDDYLGLLTDVTDLKRAERRAREQLNRLQRLTELSVTIADNLTGSPDESDELFDQLIGTLLNVFGAQFGAIGIVEESRDRGRPSADDSPRASDRAFRLQSRAVIDLEQPDVLLSPEGYKVSGDLTLVWTSGQPGLSNRSVPSPFAHRRLNGFIAARLSDGPSRLGMIFVGDRPKAFSETDRDLLQRASSIIGTVVGARLRVDEEAQQRRAAERSLREQQIEMQHMARIESMSELSAGIAHELNQPLAAIMNYADILQSKLSRLETDREDTGYVKSLELTERVGDQAARAAGIIKNLRMMLQNTTPERAPESLPQLVEQALELVRPDARLADVALTFDADDDAAERRIYANAIQIQQVVINLVQNAIDAARQQANAAVRLTVFTREGDAVLQVVDNGSGLGDRTAEEIFETFFTTKQKGLGLGLRISRTIVESHVGRITASENESGGMTFEVTLPCIEQDRLPHESASSASVA